MYPWTKTGSLTNIHLQRGADERRVEFHLSVLALLANHRQMRSSFTLLTISDCGSINSVFSLIFLVTLLSKKLYSNFPYCQIISCFKKVRF